MKKLLSILLTMAMAGAPVASNCFAFKWNGTKIEMKDEGGETRRPKSVLVFLVIRVY